MKARALVMRYMPMIPTCEEANRFIDDYLDGELPARQRVVFDWHMRLCPACREYLARYRKAIDLCRAHFYDTETDDSGEVSERILEAVQAAKRTDDSRD